MRHWFGNRIVVPVLAVCFPSVAAAGSAQDSFLKVWTEFLSVCGPILANPDGYREHLATMSHHGDVMFAGTPDEAVFEFILGPLDELGSSGQVNRLQNGTEIECESIVEVTSASPASDVELYRQMIAQSGKMHVSGGAMQDLPGSTRSYLDMDGETYVLLVSGVFPSVDLPVQVYVDASSINPRVTGMLR